MSKRIEGPTKGIQLIAAKDGDSESFFLYPSELTPEGLIAELQEMIEFIRAWDDAEFYSDLAE